MTTLTVLGAVEKAVSECWVTAYEAQGRVKALTGRSISESAITARIRDLRKPQFGAHPVTCRYFARTNGKKVYEYGICE